MRISGWGVTINPKPKTLNPKHTLGTGSPRRVAGRNIYRKPAPIAAPFPTSATMVQRITYRRRVRDTPRHPP